MSAIARCSMHALQSNLHLDMQHCIAITRVCPNPGGFDTPWSVVCIIAVRDQLALVSLF